jgi:hypothetical protein
MEPQTQHIHDTAGYIRYVIEPLVERARADNLKISELDGWLFDELDKDHTFLDGVLQAVGNGRMWDKEGKRNGGIFGAVRLDGELVEVGNLVLYFDLPPTISKYLRKFDTKSHTDAICLETAAEGEAAEAGYFLGAYCSLMKWARLLEGNLKCAVSG